MAAPVPGLVTLGGQAGQTTVFFPAQSHQGGGVGLAVGPIDGDVSPDVATASGDHVGGSLNVSSLPPPPPLPAPVVAKTANATPVKGTILVKQPGSRRFIRLEEGAQ